MYWQQQQRQQQQQQQQQQQGSRFGRSQSNNMPQSPPGWGSPVNSNLPSLLDMSGNLRRSEPLLRTPEYGNNRGPSQSTGLLESPPMAYQKSQQDMLGQLDSGIDELVAAKVRIQQAMLAASSDGFDPTPTVPSFQQYSRPQSTPDRQQQQNQWRQQSSPQYQDKRRSGGQMGRNTGGGGGGGGARGGNDGRRSGPGSGGRDNRGSGAGQNRGQSSTKKRRNSSEAYDPARPTEDDRGFASIGRPVDDLQVTIKQQSRGRAVVDDCGPARKKPMHGPRSGSKPAQQTSVENDSNKSDWFCHVCRVSCHNIKVYQVHMKSKNHLTAMEKITEVATFQSGQARKRLEAQQYLRNLEGGAKGGATASGGANNSGNNRSDREKYCRDCHKYFRGDRFDHLKSDAHKEAKKQSIPRCSACNMTFRTSQKYVQHCKGEMHKLKRDQQLKEKDEAVDDGNYVTVDAVGFDDDMEFGADFIEMELGAGDSSPEREQEEEEEDVVVISGDEKEHHDSADTDSVVVVEDDASVNQEFNQSVQAPKGQSGSEQEVQEVSDQVLVSEPDEEPVAEPVEEPSDKPVEEPSDKPVGEPSAVLMVNEANDDVKLQEGPEMELQPVHDYSKVAVTFDTKKLLVPDLQSATNGSSASSEMVISNKPESKKSDQEAPAVQAEARQEQAQDNQAGPDLVNSGQSEGKESSNMIVDPMPAVSAASDQQQDATNQQKVTQKQETEPPQQVETTELVFDPNKPVGEDYLKPVSGFFCKLCHKFLTSDKASRAHCKGKLHFKAFKEELKKKEDAGQYSADDSDPVSN